MRRNQFFLHVALIVSVSADDAEFVQMHVSGQSINSNISFTGTVQASINMANGSHRLSTEAASTEASNTISCDSQVPTEANGITCSVNGFIPDKDKAGCCRASSCSFSNSKGYVNGCPTRQSNASEGFLFAGQTCEERCNDGQSPTGKFFCSSTGTMQVKFGDKSIKNEADVSTTCQENCVKHTCFSVSTAKLTLDQQKNPMCYTRYEDALAAKIMCAVENSNESAQNYLAFAQSLKAMGVKQGGASATRFDMWKAKIRAEAREPDKAIVAIDKAIKGINELDMSEWAASKDGRLRLWSLVAAAPPIDGGEGVSLFRTLLEADYMPFENKKLIDAVKRRRKREYDTDCINTMWDMKKGRDTSYEANQRKKSFNDVLTALSEALETTAEGEMDSDKWNTVKADQKKTAAACFASLTAKMGITLDHYNAGVRFAGMSVDAIKADLANWKNQRAELRFKTDTGKHVMLARMAERLLLAWTKQAKGDASVACSTLDSFGGKLGMKNVAGDDDDLFSGPVAKQFHACNVPLLGGSSGSILEYMAFFIINKPEALTVKSVLSMMSALTALGGHGLSEQIAPVQAILSYMNQSATILDEAKFTSQTRANMRDVVDRLAPFGDVKSPLDLVYGCDAMDDKVAARKMPEFLQSMENLISVTFEDEIKSSGDDVCTMKEFDDTVAWMKKCESVKDDEINDVENQPTSAIGAVSDIISNAVAKHADPDYWNYQ
jgi:hypothetical protein